MSCADDPRGRAWTWEADLSLGTVRLAADAPVAWPQLQGHFGFVAVDFDHRCEADPPQLVAELRLTAWL